ncbi:MAG TPA: pyroglutamyl-peptidase I [Pseudolabrys sp.]|nr:pyroglutamyl-peptidase I [Pseudolabrys sp.]
MVVTILVTGFGPFPGAPFNPTGPLVQRLAQMRRSGLAEVKILAHVFPTSYAAVDRDLPKLLAKHKPDALLMFGLAPRAKTIRIETRARNAVSLLPDVGGVALHRHASAAGGPTALAMPAPARRLLAAVGATRVPATLSRDAGCYLCNYLCWRPTEAAGKKGGPQVAAFIHVPKVRRGPVPRARGKNRPLAPADLARAGGAILAAIAVSARR